jgi:hypothetical protein
MTRWLGPYIIEKCYDNGSVHIRTIDEEGIPLLVNGFRLKVYNKPLTKEEFTTTIRTQNLDVIDSKMLSIHPIKKYEKKKKRIKILDENLPEASRTDLWVKTSNGGSLISEE